MKTCTPFCLIVVLGACCSASGQTPATVPHPHSLSVNVEPTSTGGTTQTGESTHDARLATLNHPGSPRTQLRSQQTQTTKDSEALQVSVRNFGPLPDTAQVQWYFVSAPKKPNTRKPFTAQESIFDQGARNVELAARATETIPVESKAIISKIKRHDQQRFGKRGTLHRGTNGGEKDAGSVLSGWMVRVVADGQVIDSRASKEELEAVAKDDAKFNVLKQQ